MNNEIYRRTKKLVCSLSPSEKNTLNNYLNIHQLPWKKDNKPAQLLRIMDTEEKENRSSFDFSRKNYETLIERILESLAMDINIHRKPKKWKVTYLKKEYLKIQLCLDRVTDECNYKLLERWKKLAEDNHDFIEIIHVLYRQLSCTHPNDPVHFEKIRKEIVHYEYRRKIYCESLDLYYELQRKKYDHINEKLEIKGFIDKGLESLSVFHKEQNVPVVTFVYQYFLKEKAEQEGEYHEALHAIVELYSLYDEIEDLWVHHFSIWNLAYEQALLNYKTCHKKDARLFAQRCLVHKNVNLPSYHGAIELLFYIEYLDENYEEAIRLAEDYIATPYYEKNISKRMKATWIYILSCAHFQNKSFRRSQVLLEQRCILEKEYQEDAIRLKFLRIMISVELKEHDKADKLMGALKKYIARHSLIELMEKRILLPFYNALKMLQNVGYNFEEYKKKCGNECMSESPFYLYDFSTAFYRYGISYSTWLNSHLTFQTKGSKAHSNLLFTDKVEMYYQTGRMDLFDQYLNYLKEGSRVYRALDVDSDSRNFFFENTYMSLPPEDPPHSDGENSNKITSSQSLKQAKKGAIRKESLPEE